MRCLKLLKGDAISQRLDYYTTSPHLSKKLFELSGAVKKSSLGNPLLDLVTSEPLSSMGVHSVLICIARKPRSMGNGELRIYHVPIWRESTLFSETERAALEW